MGAGIIGGGLTKTLGIPKKDIRNVLIIVGLTNILAIKGGLYTFFAQSRVVLKISFLPFNLMKKKSSFWKIYTQLVGFYCYHKMFL